MAKPMIPFTHNIFMLGRFGNPQPGIQLSKQVGTDVLRPLPAHVDVGDRFFMIDSRYPAKVSDGTVMLAMVRYITPTHGGKSFATLGAPESGRPNTTLVLVKLALPGKNTTVVAGDFPVQLYTGVSGGKLVERSNDEYLVELTEGQTLTVFYEDGGVRRWRRQGQLLEERLFLDTNAVLTARIEQAKQVLAEAKEHPKAQDFVKAILLGMADLLRFTVLFDKKGEGQGLRLRLLREFFLELPEHQRVVVARSLFAALNAVDPTLLPLIQGESDSSVSATVTDIAVRRAEVAALSPQDRVAQRAANIARDEAAREAKRRRQAAIKASRQAKAKAAAEPKDGKKKKEKKAA